MYRSGNSRGAAPIILLIVLGVVGGIGYFVVDNLISRPSNDPTAPTMFAPPTFTPAAVAELPTLAPTETIAPEFPTLFIPNVGIFAPVVTLFISEGQWDVDGLGPRVGHLQRTPWVNESGNIVLAGHVEMRDGRTGIFSSLESVQRGDAVIVTENTVEHRYAVTEIKYVSPDDLSVLYPQDRDTITLITCSDFNFLSQAYEQRLVVVAERVVVQ